MANGDKRTKLFVAVTKNLKTMIGRNKNEVKNQIVKRGIAKHNVVLFRFRRLSDKQNNADLKMLGRPKFKLKPIHFRILEKTYTNFLENPDQFS